jgi:spore germination cell wall hydrolase CwlJ-like protein
MARNVTFTPRHQMLATAVAMIAALGVGIGHVQAETVNNETARALAATPPAPEAAAARVIAEETAAPKLNERHVTCVAKVVHHEAANQPRKGQIAVAHVLVNRVKKGFGDDVCDVANQPGQFFRLSRYKPNRNTAEWAEAVDVARAVLAGEVRDHSNGALFFHANWAKLNGFFRTRTKVARVEDHTFFR